MALDTSLQEHFLAKRASIDQARQKSLGSSSGGSGGSGEPPYFPSRLVERVAELEQSGRSTEKQLAVVLEKLDHVATAVDQERIRTDIATVLGKLDQKANANDLAELKGRVARIPTVPTLVAIGVLFTMLAGLARWLLVHYQF